METAVATRTDEQLLEDIRARDRTAMEELYDRYAAVLFGVARRMDPAGEAAEKLLTATMLRLWRDAARYDRSKGRFFTYIMGIMRELSIEQGMGNAPAIKGFGLHDRAAGLDPELHKVYVLRCEQGLDDEAVATLLTIPIEQVKERMRRAMKQLVNFAQR